MRWSDRARRMGALVGVAALAVTLAACAPGSTAAADAQPQVDAPLAETTQAQLQAAVDRAVAASGATGAIVGVWAPWAGSWVAGLGTIAPEGAAVSPDLSFRAGALTRPMTCDVLYAAAAEGTVKLDDPLTTWLSGFPQYDTVTLEQLCDSTSGIQSYGPLLDARWRANPARVWNPKELASYGVSRGSAAEPGAVFQDSDTGYLLLGLALERATRLSAHDMYEKYVFEPLGMTGSTLSATGEPELDGLWSGDDEAGAVACAAPVDLTALSPSTGSTASGVISDVTDLGRYTRALATGARAYDDDARFAAPQPAAGDAPAWFTADGGAYQAGSLVGQYGAVPGYLTAAFADRATGMTVVVVLNNSRAADTLVRSLSWELAAIASTTPAAPGQTAPQAGLPWTAEDMGAQVAAAAVCPLP